MIKGDLRARVLRAAEIYRKYGVTQDEISEVVGASQPQVSRVLKGDHFLSVVAFAQAAYAKRVGEFQ